MNETKKRKRDIITELGIIVENELLGIKIPDYIPCIICKTPVYHYRCLKEVVCSYDCYSIFELSQQDSFIDEKTIRRSSFEDQASPIRFAQFADAHILTMQMSD